MRKDSSNMCEEFVDHGDRTGKRVKIFCRITQSKTMTRISIILLLYVILLFL